MMSVAVLGSQRVATAHITSAGLVMSMSLTMMMMMMMMMICSPWGSGFLDSAPAGGVLYNDYDHKPGPRHKIFMHETCASGKRDGQSACCGENHTGRAESAAMQGICLPGIYARAPCFAVSYRDV